MLVVKPGTGSSPAVSLTLVVPVNAGDLDLLRGQVLLQKLLALEPVPERALACVSVPPDHYLHCREKHTHMGG